MNAVVRQFTEFVENSDEHNKETLITKACEKFNLTKDRSVFYCEAFAVRFCQTKNGSFSNTVLSLSALQKYDHIPFLVVLINTTITGKARIFLANSTFISKISHSSQQLSRYNIRGSFNGSDIIKEPFNIPNDKDHVEELFAFHTAISWDENFTRILNNTNGIIPKGQPFFINDKQKDYIFNSIDRAVKFIKSNNFEILKNDLDGRVEQSREAIICAAHIENVNIRGRLIEALITADPKERQQITTDLRTVEEALPTYRTKNELSDYYRCFGNEETYTDIKTKVIYLGSNPKAYNVDKFLEVMSKPNSVFFFYFIGIDEQSIINKILCSVYHSQLIDNTVVQFHWAGRNSRGVTQFIGTALNDMLAKQEFANHIDSQKAKSFLEKLINSKSP